MVQNKNILVETISWLVTLSFYPVAKVGNGFVYLVASLFGSSREGRSRAKITESAADLQRRIDAYQVKIETKINDKKQALEQCKSCMRQNEREQARVYLGTSRKIEKELTTLRAVHGEMQKMHDTLTHQLLATEVVHDQREVAAVMRKHVKGDLISEAEAMHDDIADADDVAAELRELMSGWAEDNNGDDEDELQKLEEMMLDEVLIDVPAGVPVTTPAPEPEPAMEAPAAVQAPAAEAPTEDNGSASEDESVEVATLQATAG